MFPVLCACSRSEVKGANSDSERAPGYAHQGVQPHQPGAQPAGQETEEGKRLDSPGRLEHCTEAAFQCGLNILDMFKIIAEVVNYCGWRQTLLKLHSVPLEEKQNVLKLVKKFS